MIIKNDTCTGCSACKNICPQKCISMEIDEMGFLYPKVDERKCINCNLCNTVCYINSKNLLSYEKPKLVYAAWSLDVIDRSTSSSGGVASVLSHYIVENGGYVFGAVIQDGLKIRHCGTSDINYLHKFKTSKYAQSDTQGAYPEIKELLSKDKRVLFIGTPCQCAGLLCYLGGRQSNLVTVDLVCHGVPSSKYLYESIVNEHVINNYTSVVFRDETGYKLKFYYQDKIIFCEGPEDNLFVRGFLDSLFIRESCYQCKFAREERISDITIGDFWGISDEDEFKDELRNGISMILVNTSHGMDIIKKCHDKMFLRDRSLEEAIQGNQQLRRPTIRPKENTKFKLLYPKKGFIYAASSCLEKRMRKEKFIKVLKDILLKLIKKGG